MTRTPPLDPQAGFTLVEMLVALVLLGLVTAALMAGLRLAVDAGQHVLQAGREHQQSAIAESRLRDLVGAALPWRDAAGKVQFAGTDDGLDWVAVADGPQGDRRPYAFHLQVARPNLTLTLCPVLTGTACATDALTETLPAAFSTLQYRQGGEWQSRWIDDQRLPAAIRLHRIAEIGAQQADLVITIALGAE
jgi:prepilin-type N-terminal cleavage/methylation domain-containing protein